MSIVSPRVHMHTTRETSGVVRVMLSMDDQLMWVDLAADAATRQGLRMIALARGFPSSGEPGPPIGEA